MAITVRFIHAVWLVVYYYVVLHHLRIATGGRGGGGGAWYYIYFVVELLPPENNLKKMSDVYLAYTIRTPNAVYNFLRFMFLAGSRLLLLLNSLASWMAGRSVGWSSYDDVMFINSRATFFFVHSRHNRTEHTDILKFNIVMYIQVYLFLKRIVLNSRPVVMFWVLIGDVVVFGSR